MNAFRPVRGVVAALSCAALAACLSSAPALPPVRWFDPLPPAGAAAAAAPAAVRAMAAPHLRQPFAVRVGPREFALDPQHQWVDEPAALCAALVGRALAGRVAGGAAIQVDAFELDVTAAPRAHVRFAFVGEAPAGAPPVVDAWADAADRSPAACAEAMAQALAQAAATLAPAR
jgi:hypothetical protein